MGLVLPKIRSAWTRNRPGCFKLLVLILIGKACTSGGFGKVIKMMDDIVTPLEKKQSEDDDQRAHFADPFDVSDDK